MKSHLVFDCLLNAAFHEQCLNEVPDAITALLSWDIEDQRAFTSRLVRSANVVHGAGAGEVVTAFLARHGVQEFE